VRGTKAAATGSIAIVVPTRDRIALLHRAVWSVLSQSDANWELIVVDDASTDGTSEWLASLKDPRVRVTRNATHSERSESRNTGLAQASSPYVMFLDDDDELLLDAVAVMRHAVSEHGECVAVVAARIDRHAGESRRARHPKRARLARPGSVLAGWQPGQGQWTAQTTAVRAAGAWPTHLVAGEDQWLWMNLERLGPVLLIPETIVAVSVPDVSRRQTDRTHEELSMRTELLERLGLSESRADARLLSCWRTTREAAAAAAHGEYARACFLYARLWSPRLRGVPTLRSVATTGFTHALAHTVFRR
jgi:hypothetical protein